MLTALVQVKPEQSRELSRASTSSTMMATFRLLLLVLLRASATEAQRGQGTGTAGEGTAPACARGGYIGDVGKFAHRKRVVEHWDRESPSLEVF